MLILIFAIDIIINPVSPRLSGMGNLKYVVKEYPNQFNFYDYGNNPANIIDDVDEENFIRNFHSFGTGDWWTYLSHKYVAGLSFFRGTSDFTYGSHLKYYNYSLFDEPPVLDAQIPGGSFLIARRFPFFRAGIAFTYKKFLQKLQDEWDTYEDIYSINLGVSNSSLELIANSRISLGINAQFKLISEEGIESDFTRIIGTQALLELSEDDLLLYSAAVGHNRIEPSEPDTQTYNYNLNTHDFIYEHRLVNGTSIIRFDMAMKLKFSSLRDYKTNSNSCTDRGIITTLGLSKEDGNNRIFGIEYSYIHPFKENVDDFHYLRLGFEIPSFSKTFIRGGVERKVYPQEITLDFLTALLNPDIYALGYGFKRGKFEVEISYNYLHGPGCSYSNDHQFSLLFCYNL